MYKICIREVLAISGDSGSRVNGTIDRDCQARVEFDLKVKRFKKGEIDLEQPKT